MLNLLIVDDSKTAHLFVSSMLKDCPINFSHAYDGQEAVDLVSGGLNPDIILIDWEMPRLEGPDAVSQIRNCGFSGPILMITTRSSPNDIRAALQKGVSEFMMKPFTKDILVEKLESLNISIGI